MNCVERIKEICAEKGISLHKLETDLGYSNGYIGGLKKGTLPADRLSEVAAYLEVSTNYLLTGEDNPDQPVYYFNSETAAMAQALFESPDLRLLFDAAQDATPEDLKITADLLSALKKKERGEIDD